MKTIYLLDEITEATKEKARAKGYRFADTQTPEAIFVRSKQVPDALITAELAVIARSGSGTNTINIDKCTENGTVVFNSPGVNANAVKELVLTNLFLSVRPLDKAHEVMSQIEVEIAKGNIAGDAVLATAEERRSTLIGEELTGKTIGILGLGEIGERLAEACYHLGMDVIGYARTQKDSMYFEQTAALSELLKEADFVVVLLPLNDQTQGLINEEAFASMKPEATLLNFGRGEIVDETAVLKALDSGRIKQYITDFPTASVVQHPKVVTYPHIGGTTVDALTAGDRIVFARMDRFLRYGTIKESVNFPEVTLPFLAPYRLTIFHKDAPGALAPLLKLLSDAAIDIAHLASERKAGMAYTIIDVAEQKVEEVQQAAAMLQEVPQVHRVRLLHSPHLDV